MPSSASSSSSEDFDDDSSSSSSSTSYSSSFSSSSSSSPIASTSRSNNKKNFFIGEEPSPEQKKEAPPQHQEFYEQRTVLDEAAVDAGHPVSVVPHAPTAGYIMKNLFDPASNNNNKNNNTVNQKTLYGAAYNGVIAKDTLAMRRLVNGSWLERVPRSLMKKATMKSLHGTGQLPTTTVWTSTRNGFLALPLYAPKQQKLPRRAGMPAPPPLPPPNWWGRAVRFTVSSATDATTSGGPDQQQQHSDFDNTSSTPTNTTISHIDIPMPQLPILPLNKEEKEEVLRRYRELMDQEAKLTSQPSFMKSTSAVSGHYGGTAEEVSRKEREQEELKLFMRTQVPPTVHKMTVLGCTNRSPDVCWVILHQVKRPSLMKRRNANSTNTNTLISGTTTTHNNINTNVTKDSRPTSSATKKSTTSSTTANRVVKPLDEFDLAPSPIKKEKPSASSTARNNENEKEQEDDDENYYSDDFSSLPSSPSPVSKNKQQKTKEEGDTEQEGDKDNQEDADKTTMEEEEKIEVKTEDNDGGYASDDHVFSSSSSISSSSDDDDDDSFLMSSAARKRKKARKLREHYHEIENGWWLAAFHTGTGRWVEEPRPIFTSHLPHPSSSASQDEKNLKNENNKNNTTHHDWGLFLSTCAISWVPALCSFVFFGGLGVKTHDGDNNTSDSSSRCYCFTLPVQSHYFSGKDGEIQSHEQQQEEVEKKKTRKHHHEKKKKGNKRKRHGEKDKEDELLNELDHQDTNTTPIIPFDHYELDNADGVCQIAGRYHHSATPISEHEVVIVGGMLRKDHHQQATNNNNNNKAHHPQQQQRNTNKSRNNGSSSSVPISGSPLIVIVDLASGTCRNFELIASSDFHTFHPRVKHSATAVLDENDERYLIVAGGNLVSSSSSSSHQQMMQISIINLEILESVNCTITAKDLPLNGVPNSAPVLAGRSGRPLMKIFDSASMNSVVEQRLNDDQEKIDFEEETVAHYHKTHHPAGSLEYFSEKRKAEKQLIQDTIARAKNPKNFNKKEDPTVDEPVSHKSRRPRFVIAVCGGQKLSLTCGPSCESGDATFVELVSPGSLFEKAFLEDHRQLMEAHKPKQLRGSTLTTSTSNNKNNKNRREGRGGDESNSRRHSRRLNLPSSWEELQQIKEQQREEERRIKRQQGAALSSPVKLDAVKASARHHHDNNSSSSSHSSDDSDDFDESSSASQSRTASSSSRHSYALSGRNSSSNSRPSRPQSGPQKRDGDEKILIGQRPTSSSTKKSSSRKRRSKSNESFEHSSSSSSTRTSSSSSSSSSSSAVSPRSARNTYASTPQPTSSRLDHHHKKNSALVVVSPENEVRPNSAAISGRAKGRSLSISPHANSKNQNQNQNQNHSSSYARISSAGSSRRFSPNATMPSRLRLRLLASRQRAINTSQIDEMAERLCPSHKKKIEETQKLIMNMKQQMKEEFDHVPEQEAAAAATVKKLSKEEMGRLYDDGVARKKVARKQLIEKLTQQAEQNRSKKTLSDADFEDFINRVYTKRLGKTRERTNMSPAAAIRSTKHQPGKNDKMKISRLK